MIPLTRLNNSRIYLNPDLIKRIEETPDTIVTLVNDDHYVVREAAAEVIDRIVAYRVRVLRESSFVPSSVDSKPGNANPGDATES